MRQNVLEVAVGAKGIGKTFIAREIIKRYTMSDTKTGRKARPVLIFDVNNEELYNDYKALDFDITEENEYIRAKEIRTITVPKPYRILPFKKDRQPMTTTEIVLTCITIAKYFKNGMLVLEDINKYMLSNLNVDFIGLLIGIRHKGVDLMIHYQSLAALPPRLWQNVNYIRWHKQTGNIDTFKQRIPNYELCKLAEFIVNDQFQRGNNRYYLWVGVADEKLLNVSEVDFKNACINYLSQNPKEIKDLQRLGTINKVNVESKESAVAYWINSKKHYIS